MLARSKRITDGCSGTSMSADCSMHCTWLCTVCTTTTATASWTKWICCQFQHSVLENSSLYNCDGIVKTGRLTEKEWCGSKLNTGLFFRVSRKIPRRFGNASKLQMQRIVGESLSAEAKANPLLLLKHTHFFPMMCSWDRIKAADDVWMTPWGPTSCPIRERSSLLLIFQKKKNFCEDVGNIAWNYHGSVLRRRELKPTENKIYQNEINIPITEFLYLKPHIERTKKSQSKYQSPTTKFF